MRFNDALSALGAYWGVPFSELTSYQRALRQARALPLGESGRGVLHATADDLLRFVLAFCSARTAISAPARLQLLLSAVRSDPDDESVPKELKSAFYAKDILTCLNELVCYDDNNDTLLRVRVSFDLRDAFVELDWRVGRQKYKTHYFDNSTPEHQIPEKSDLSETRSIGDGTFDFIRRAAWRGHK